MNELLFYIEDLDKLNKECSKPDEIDEKNED